MSDLGQRFHRSAPGFGTTRWHHHILIPADYRCRMVEVVDLSQQFAQPSEIRLYIAGHMCPL